MVGQHDSNVLTCLNNKVLVNNNGLYHLEDHDYFNKEPFTLSPMDTESNNEAMEETSVNNSQLLCSNFHKFNIESFEYVSNDHTLPYCFQSQENFGEMVEIEHLGQSTCSNSLLDFDLLDSVASKTKNHTSHKQIEQANKNHSKSPGSKPQDSNNIEKEKVNHVYPQRSCPDYLEPANEELIELICDDSTLSNTQNSLIEIKEKMPIDDSPPSIGSNSPDLECVQMEEPKYDNSYSRPASPSHQDSNSEKMKKANYNDSRLSCSISNSINKERTKFTKAENLRTPTLETHVARKKCNFVGCSTSKAKFPQLHFYRFPIRRPDICDKWVFNCANETLSDLPMSKLNHRVVCELHFEDDSFTNDMRLRVKQTAVPTLVARQSVLDDLQAENELNKPSSLPEIPVSSRKSSNESSDDISCHFMSDKRMVDSVTEVSSVSNRVEPAKKQLTPTSTRSAREVNLAGKVNRLMKEKRNLIKQVKRLQKKVEKLSRAQVIEKALERLPEKVVQFIDTQIKHCFKEKLSWTSEEMLLALRFWHVSPALYQQMRRDGFALPARSTINRWLEFKSIKTTNA